ncbi:MAG: class B sortase [Eggerthellaceae bacterium]|nr:class B sortase [Eggerthellaceae bacterium]
MKAFKRIASALGVLFLSVAFATLVTYLTTPEEDRPDIVELTESFDADGGQERAIDWDSLPSEVVAWIEAPGTSIDEPIVQATLDAPNAYLYMDALGQGAYGTPFIDCECALDSPFVMAYGHHMSDGTVFADFAKFADRDYAKEHEVIYVYTRSDNKRHELEVKAVDVVNANRETLRTSFGTDEERDAYLNDSIAKSDLVLGGDALIGEALWAFATCSYQTSNSRTVVYASAPQSTS